MQLDVAPDWLKLSPWEIQRLRELVAKMRVMSVPSNGPVGSGMRVLVREIPVHAVPATMPTATGTKPITQKVKYKYIHNSRHL